MIPDSDHLTGKGPIDLAPLRPVSWLNITELLPSSNGNEEPAFSTVEERYVYDLRGGNVAEEEYAFTGESDSVSMLQEDASTSLPPSNAPAHHHHRQEETPLFRTAPQDQMQQLPQDQILQDLTTTQLDLAPWHHSLGGRTPQAQPQHISLSAPEETPLKSNAKSAKPSPVETYLSPVRYFMTASSKKQNHALLVDTIKPLSNDEAVEEASSMLSGHQSVDVSSSKMATPVLQQEALDDEMAIMHASAVRLGDSCKTITGFLCMIYAAAESIFNVIRRRPWLLVVIVSCVYCATIRSGRLSAPAPQSALEIDRYAEALLKASNAIGGPEHDLSTTGVDTPKSGFIVQLADNITKDARCVKRARRQQQNGYADNGYPDSTANGIHGPIHTRVK
jgi:hypothetical protein